VHRTGLRCSGQYLLLRRTSSFAGRARYTETLTSCYSLCAASPALYRWQSDLAPRARLELATLRLTGSGSKNPKAFFGVAYEPETPSKPPSIVRNVRKKPCTAHTNLFPLSITCALCQVKEG